MKLIHSIEYNETAQDLTAKLLEFQTVVSFVADGPVHTSELLIDTPAEGNAQTGHLHLIEDTLTDGSKVYSVRIN
jgi:hypothetical protein